MKGRGYQFPVSGVRWRALMGRALMGRALLRAPLGPYGPPWALVGRALMGPPGPLWAGPLWAPRGPYGPGPYGPGPCGPPGPSWAWALIGLRYIRAG